MAEGEMDLSSVIEKLMNSSETAGIIEKLKASVENAPSDTPNEEVKPDAKGSAELSDKLPQVMAALAPLLENGTLAKPSIGDSARKRNALLSALRPYLSEGRQGLIDSIMTLTKFSGLVDLLPRNK